MLIVAAFIEFYNGIEKIFDKFILIGKIPRY